MPHYNWRHSPTARVDACNAKEHYDAGHTLTDREWAMWVWTMTDVPTCPVCAGSSGTSLGASGYWAESGLPHPAPKLRHVAGLSYYSPGQIARKDGDWDRASGGRMAKWILLLDDKTSRKSALSAHGSLARLDSPDMPNVPDTPLTLVGMEGGQSR